MSNKENRYSDEYEKVSDARLTLKWARGGGIPVHPKAIANALRVVQANPELNKQVMSEIEQARSSIYRSR